MSESKITDIPTNEEVVNELLEKMNLEGENVQNEETDLHSSDYETQDVPKDFELSDTEDDVKSTVPDDFIDEALMKSEEETLTENEKQTRKKQALDLKLSGNEEFKNEKYIESVRIYTAALRLCPLSYPMDRSVLYCNRGASKIKLGRKETALEDCTKAIELNQTYLKAYLRRAKLYEELDKLDESLTDYKKIIELDPRHNEAQAALIRLPPIINERNEKLKTEMLGKLKDLGNMILRPFGLSTNNFKVQQDPNSGGYSVNFQQNQQ